MAAQVTYRSIKKIKREHPEAVIYECSDPRFKGILREFSEQFLGKKAVFPIAKLGGILPIVLSENRNSANWKSVLSGLEKVIKVTNEPFLVVVLHEDCQWVNDSYNGQIPENKWVDEIVSAIEKRVLPLVSMRYVKLEIYWLAIGKDERGEFELLYQERLQMEAAA